jgi:hypothetical protein
MSCPAGAHNRYKPTIEVNAIYWINKSRPQPTTTTTTTSTTFSFPFPTTTRPGDDDDDRRRRPHTGVIRPATIHLNDFVGEPGCSLPPQCYFFTYTTMKQCQ